MLRDFGVGAAGQPDVVGLVGPAREDLGPVDDVLLTVAHGPRAQRGEVGAGPGLGVADGEVQLAGEDLRQEERLLLVGTEAHDGRPDGVDGDEGERRTGAPCLVEEDELVRRRPALPAELRGPPDAEPAVLADLAHHLGPGLAALAALGKARPHLVGEELGVVLTQLGAKLLLFGALFEEHRGAASRAFCGPCQVKAALRKTVTRSRLGGPGRRLRRAGWAAARTCPEPARRPDRTRPEISRPLPPGRRGTRPSPPDASGGSPRWAGPGA